MQDTPNLEIISYHHVCSYPSLFKKVNMELFKNPRVKLLYDFTKEFYVKYGQIPFDHLNPDVAQLREYVKGSKKFLEHNKLSTEDPMTLEKSFITEAELIIRHPINKYNKGWMIESAEAWIEWGQFINGIKKVVDWQSKLEVTPQNVKELVSKGQSMFLDNSQISLHEEEALDFWNPADHKQPEAADYINTGWHFMDKILGGGFERGTLTHLWGQTNIGKTIWLGNIGLNVSLLGNNVYFASLEMGSNKIIKRMGSNIFNQTMDTYYELANNTEFLGQRMNEFKEGRMFNEMAPPPGELRIQRFSEATPIDVYASADRLAKQLGIEWALIIIDYLGEMKSSHGFTLNDMYSMHKMNNSDLYANSVKRNLSTLTAFQIKPDAFGADDYGLSAAAESRGITHRTDNIVGLIQTPAMKAERMYYAKAIKTRDNEYKDYQIGYSIDYSHMRLRETEVFNPPLDIAGALTMGTS